MLRISISDKSRLLLLPTDVCLIRLWDGCASLMFILIVVHAAFIDIGGRSYSFFSVAVLASTSASLFRHTLLCPRIHWIFTSAIRWSMRCMIFTGKELVALSAMQNDCESFLFSSIYVSALRPACFSLYDGVNFFQRRLSSWVTFGVLGGRVVTIVVAPPS